MNIIHQHKISSDHMKAFTSENLRTSNEIMNSPI